MRLRLLILTFVTGLSGVAAAGPRDFVVERSGVGGSTEQAAPYLDTFFRYLEKTLGWPTGSVGGQFFTEPQPAREFVAAKKPGFGLLDPDLWLELRKKDELTV